MVCFKIFVGLLLFNEVIVHIVEKVDWGLDIRKCVNISLRLAAGGVTNDVKRAAYSIRSYIKNLSPKDKESIGYAFYHGIDETPALFASFLDGLVYTEDPDTPIWKALDTFQQFVEKYVETEKLEAERKAARKGK